MTKKQTKTPPAKRTARHAEAVAPWRDWARRLCEKSGDDWEAFERATATANGSAPGDFCGMLYDAAQGAFRDFPPAVAAAGLRELETAFGVAAGKPKTEGIVRRAVALNALPRTLRRLAESPAATPTESPNADAVREVSARLGKLEAHTARTAEAVANLAAVAEKRREGGRKGGRVSARSRGRNPEVAPALDRMGERLRAGKSQSILAAARWVSAHGSPLLKADGEELKPETLARYYKARTAKRRRRADAERG